MGVFFVTKGKNQILQKYFINNTIQYFNRTDNSIEIAIVADKIRLIVITPPLESIDKWFEYLNANVSSQPKDDLFLNPRSNTTKFNSKKRKPFKSLRSRTSKQSNKERKYQIHFLVHLVINSKYPYMYHVVTSI